MKKKSVKKYRAIESRVFVASDKGEHVQVNGVKVDVFNLDDREVCFVYDALPPQFDTLFPQDIFIIYQDGDGFFEADRLGMMLILRGFVTEMEPYVTVLMVEKETGRIRATKPEFKHTFSSIEEHIGESG